MSAQVQMMVPNTTVNLAETFGFHLDTGSTYEVVASKQEQFIPKADSNYIFKRDVTFLKVFNYINGNKRRPMFIGGSSGIGKTSLPLQICARLGIPAIVVSCGSETTFEDLFGFRDLEGGSTTFVAGPVTYAMENDCVIVLDEADQLPPELSVKMNGFTQPDFDGVHRILLETDGMRVVESTPGFRLFATGNSNGTGDEHMLYSGVKSQSVAVRSRYDYVDMPYPSVDTEVKVLTGMFPHVDKSIIDCLVRAANMVRFVHVGSSEQQLKSVKKRLSITGDALDIGSDTLESGMLNSIFTLRHMITVVDYFDLYGGIPGVKPMQVAIEEVFLNASPSDERAALVAIFQLALGDYWDMATTAQELGMSQADFDAYLEEDM